MGNLKISDNMKKDNEKVSEKSYSSAFRTSNSFTSSDSFKPTNLFTNSESLKPTDSFAKPETLKSTGSFTNHEPSKPTNSFTNSDSFKPTGSFTKPEPSKPTGSFTKPEPTDMPKSTPGIRESEQHFESEALVYKKKNPILKIAVIIFIVLTAMVSVYWFVLRDDTVSNDDIVIENTIESEEVSDTSNTESKTDDKKEQAADVSSDSLDYKWYLEPTIEADELYVYDIAEYADEKLSPYEYLAIIKNGTSYNVIDYNGKTYFKNDTLHDYSINICQRMEFVPNTSDNDWMENVTAVYYNDNSNIVIEENTCESAHGMPETGYYFIKNNELYYKDGWESETKADIKLSNTFIIKGDNNKFGLASSSAEILVECDYNYGYKETKGNTSYFSDDLINWKAYNKDGKKIFECKSVDINENSIHGIYDYSYFRFNYSDDEKVYDESITFPFYPTNEIAAVYNEKGCAYLDEKTGEEIVRFGEFEEVRPVYHNLAWVKKNGKWGVIQFGEKNTYSLPEIADSIDYSYETESKLTNNSDVNAHKFIYDELVPKYGLSQKIYFENINWTYLEVHDYPDNVQGILSVPYLDDKSFIIARLEARSMFLDYYVANGNAFDFVNSIKLYDFNSKTDITSFKLYTCGEDKIIYSYHYTSPPAGSTYGTHFGVIEITSSGISENLKICGLRNPGTTMIAVDSQEWSCKESEELDYSSIKDEITKKLKDLNIDGCTNIEVGWIGDCMYGVEFNNNWLNVISLNYNESSGSYFTDASVLRNKFFIEQAGLDYNNIIGENNSDINNFDNSNETLIKNNEADNNVNYGTVTTDGDELFVRSSPEIINSPGKGNKLDCYPNGTRLEIDIDKSTSEWYYATGKGLSGNIVSGYVSKQFVVLD